MLLRGSFVGEEVAGERRWLLALRCGPRDGLDDDRPREEEDKGTKMGMYMYAETDSE